MRKILLAPPPAQDLVAKLKELCDVAVHRVENGGDDCSAIFDEIERLCGVRFDEDYFLTLHGWASHDDFAQLAALGAPPHVQDITREELIGVVELILSSTFPVQDYYVALFGLNVPHPQASDLIFWPESYWPDDHEPTPAEIVDKALASGPIQL